MSEPAFETITTRDGRRLVRCVIGGVEGSARVFTAGEQEARDRAEAQARKKLAERDGPAE